jgi:hypothetical protein
MAKEGIWAFRASSVKMKRSTVGDSWPAFSMTIKAVGFATVRYMFCRAGGYAGSGQTLEVSKMVN